MTFENSLAPYNRMNKAMIPALLLAVLSVILFYTSDRINSAVVIIFIGVVYLVLITLIIKGYKSYDIFFDRSNMYLRGDKGVLTIPYTDVKRLKMMLGNITIMGMRSYQYKIEYSDSGGESCEITFWTSLGSKDMDQFEEHAKEVNRSIRIEHWANSGEV